MNYLSVEALTKSYGERTLFEAIAFGLEQGQKAALVGVNGCGKSTLLKILAGEETPDSGSFSFNKEIRVAFLSQNPAFDEGDTAFEAIFYAPHKPLQVIKEYEWLSNKGEMNEQEMERFQQLMVAMDDGQLWDYESQVKQILGQLGITRFDQKIQDMSGGQRKRVALARELIVQPDLLLLDEPTNHLDLEVIEWLENYLSTSTMTLLMVTHDRYFLDRVCNTICEIEDQQLYQYAGNYTYYLEKKAEREASQRAEVDKARNLMRKELDWMRRQPKARGTKAKYRVEAFHDLKDKASQNLRKEAVEMDVKGRRLGGKILEMEHVGFAYGELPIVKNFSHKFVKGERLGIVGPNGVGKSTFLEILTTKLNPDKGEIDKGLNTVFGFYTQEPLEYKPEQKVIDLVKSVAEHFEQADGSQLSASQFLNKFLFPPKKQHDFIEKLSGGEKRRLQLLMVLIQNPNFLILDEPTNDLDIVTLNVLEEFLDSYKGCLLLVSHDRYFMDRLVDHLLVFEGQGVIRDFPGNYTDYREWKKEQDREAQREAKKEEKAAPAPKPEKPKANTSAKLSYKEKREMEQLEEEMPKLQAQKQELEAKLAKGEGSPDEFIAWGKTLEELNDALDEKEMRWLELSERV